MPTNIKEPVLMFYTTLTYPLTLIVKSFFTILRFKAKNDNQANRHKIKTLDGAGFFWGF